MPNLTEALTVGVQEERGRRGLPRAHRRRGRRQGGLTGLAIKAGYKTVQGIKPGFVRQVVVGPAARVRARRSSPSTRRRRPSGSGVRDHFTSNSDARRRRAAHHHRREGEALQERHGQGHLREAPRQREEERRGRRAAARRDDREARVVTGPARTTRSSSRPRGSRPTSTTPGVRVVDIRGKVLPAGQRPALPCRSARTTTRATCPAPCSSTGRATSSTRTTRCPCRSHSPTRSRRRWASSASATTRSSSPTTTTTTPSPAASRGRSATTGTTPCALLDGGWSRWVAEGRPTTSQTSRSAAPAHASRPRPRPALRRTADEVARALGRCGRAAHRRPAARAVRGRRRAPPRAAGHIPGARNVPYATPRRPADRAASCRRAS